MSQTGFTKIITYNTATAAAVPLAADLEQGELSVNVTDKKLYTKDGGGSVVQVGSGPSAVETLTNKTLTSPIINAPTGLVKGDVGLGSVDNTSDANKPVSTAQQTALNLKANIASPTFTGTVGGITSAMVGLGNVDNTSDANKPVSAAQQTALNLKQDADADLTAIAGLTGAGVLIRTGAGTAAVRTLIAGTGCVITDGDGVAGNPTISLTLGPGSGDVTGPAGATDGNLALFNGATGKIIKESALKTVNSTSLLGAGDVAVQATLVSGTNIKTVNGNALLGAGDVVIPTGLTQVNVTGTSQAAVTGEDYLLSNVAATTVTAPASGEFAVSPVNSLFTNVIDFGAATVTVNGKSTTGTITLDLGARMHFKYSSAISKWVVQ